MPRRASPPPRNLPTLIKEVRTLVEPKWKTADKYFQVSIKYDGVFLSREREISKHFASLGLELKVLIERSGFQGVKLGKTMTFLCTKIDKNNG
jgi:hypothetical protein